MFYFYVLQSLRNTEWFYKGSTIDLQQRISQHNNGEVDATRPYKPLRLVYYEAFISERAARLRESAIKQNGNMWTPLRRRIIESLAGLAAGKSPLNDPS